MIRADYPEIIRYLGYKHGAQPEPQVMDRIEHCVNELQKLIAPKSVYQMFSVFRDEKETIIIDTMKIHSRHLARNLKGCREVCLFAATLGIGPDRLIQRAQIRRIADAVIYQAASAAMIETYCDQINEEITQSARQRGMYTRPRFSPGYGDLPLELQKDFLQILKTSKNIGLTLTDSLLMMPSKSVSAIIGLADTDEKCHTKGCRICTKKDCEFRLT